MASTELSEALRCMCRACSVALATWSPRYLETRTEPNSAALNLAGVWIRAQVTARAIADCSVVPHPRREQACSIHMKCHPASRTARSSCAGAAFSTDIHLSSKCFCFRWSPFGKTQPTRRKITGGFTTSVCRLSRCQEHGQRPGPGRSCLGDCSCRTLQPGHPVLHRQRSPSHLSVSIRRRIRT